MHCDETVNRHEECNRSTSLLDAKGLCWHFDAGAHRVVPACDTSGPMLCFGMQSADGSGGGGGGVASGAAQRPRRPSMFPMPMYDDIGTSCRNSPYVCERGIIKLRKISFKK